MHYFKGLSTLVTVWMDAKRIITHHNALCWTSVDSVFLALVLVHATIKEMINFISLNYFLLNKDPVSHS